MILPAPLLKDDLCVVHGRPMNEIAEVHMRTAYELVLEKLQSLSTPLDGSDNLCVLDAKRLANESGFSAVQEFWTNDVLWCLAGFLRAYISLERVAQTISHIPTGEESTQELADFASNPALPSLTRCAYLILTFREEPIRRNIIKAIANICG